MNDLQPIADTTATTRVGAEFLVICLCAEWCATCREYRAGFDELAERFPDTHFRWLDIEDQADDLGDIDIENFPTLFVQRGDAVLFFGTMLPHLGHLRRLVETFHEQTAEQSGAYARSAPERCSWQENPDLRNLWRAVAP